MSYMHCCLQLSVFHALKALKRENRLLVQQEVRGNVEKKEISGE